MTLYLIGIGLFDEKDISLRGLEIVKKCKEIYLENYTSLLSCSLKEMEKLYGKKVILADREMVEKKAEEVILKKAADSDVAFLVIGDPMSATTHMDLVLRAKEKGIEIITIGTDDADRAFLAELASSQKHSYKVDPNKLDEAIASAARLLPEGK